MPASLTVEVLKGHKALGITGMYFKHTPNDLLEGNDKIWAMRKLLYPGDNYVRDFSGTTNPNGQFVYHWTIGENGDAGELTIEAQIVASGYESQRARNGFQITEG